MSTIHERLIEWCQSDPDNNDEPIPQELIDEWPDCVAPGCLNKCSLRMRSPYCHPHTMERIQAAGLD